MGKRKRNWKFWCLLLLMLFFAGGVTLQTTTSEVQAATKTKSGWETTAKGKYYYKNGKACTGWQTIGKKKYYFNPSTKLMTTGCKWISGYWYYFGTDGAMRTNTWGKNVSGGKTYYLYFQSNGKAVKKAFKTIDGKTYYFSSRSVMVTNWWNINGSRYYFGTDGVRHSGWLYQGDKTYWFHQSTGKMRTGEVKNAKGDARYFSKMKDTYGEMVKGWAQFGKTKFRYYYQKTGIRVMKGYLKIDGDYYYIKNGYRVFDCWMKNGKGERRYFFSDGVMATGKQTIDGKKYEFSSNGVLIKEPSEGSAEQPTSSKTVKNYLLNALKPVGSTLYVWGGGWAQPTVTYKGLYPKWKQWYDANSGSYDYNDYRDLSVATRAKGLDCSGFVAWSTYNVMQTKSGVGAGYATSADSVAATYAGFGWGTKRTQATLKKNNYRGQFKAGDVASSPGHAWIVLGQCDDGSYVIVHSTPPCVQIAGTPTPSGNYSSEAISLARKYMKKYYSSTVNKFGLGSSTGYATYFSGCNTMRWKSSVLSDPDGYLSMDAAEILADLFGEV